MALHADTVWEVRASASNNNGGGWHDAGGASADHSQQDAANESWSNLSISGTTLTDDDAGGKFTAAMLGNIINILTVGRFEISTVTDGDNVELDRAPGDGSGYTGYEGGAVADLEEIDSIVVAGNDIHLKAGTYTAGGNIYFTANGTVTSKIRILGYNASRGDEPSGNDRPLIDVQTNYLRHGTNYDFDRVRMTGDGTYTFYGPAADLSRYCRCRFENTRVAINAYASYSTGQACLFEHCEFVCDNGYAVHTGGTMTRFMWCYAHDSRSGYYLVATDLIVVHCIADSNDFSGFYGGQNGLFVFKCTAYNNTTGIFLSANSYSYVVNCQVISNDNGVTCTGQSFLRRNNYYDNTNDVSGGIVKESDATADDPGFANAAGGDFSGVDDANAEVIELGVG